MNMKEEKKQIVLNLNLPLIELNTNEVWNIEHYKDSGVFFVKTKDGIYHLVEVDKDQNVNETCLFPNVCNKFTEKMAELSIRDEIRSMITSLSESIRGEFETSRKEFQSSVLDLENCLNEDKYTIIEKLEELVEKLKQAPSEDTSKVIQGYISESALMDVLRTIK